MLQPITRRAALSGATTFAIALPFGRAALAGGRSSQAVFVYAAAHPQAIAYGRKNDWDRIALTGDFSAEWARLDRRMAAAPVALVGMTTRDQFACFEILARTRRLRLTMSNTAHDNHILWRFDPIVAIA